MGSQKGCGVRQFYEEQRESIPQGRGLLSLCWNSVQSSTNKLRTIVVTHSLMLLKRRDLQRVTSKWWIWSKLESKQEVVQPKQHFKYRCTRSTPRRSDFRGLSPPIRPKLQFKIRLVLMFGQQSLQIICASGAISSSSIPYDLFLGPRLTPRTRLPWNMSTMQKSLKLEFIMRLHLLFTRFTLTLIPILSSLWNKDRDGSLYNNTKEDQNGRFAHYVAGCNADFQGLTRPQKLSHTNVPCSPGV